MKHSDNPDHAAVLDRRVLDDLRKLTAKGHVNYLNKIIALYEKSAPALAKGVHEAVARNDANALLAASHSLKTSSAMLGATRLSSLCREFETMARSNSLQNAASLLSTFDAECDRVFRSLKQEISANRSGEGAAP